MQRRDQRVAGSLFICVLVGGRRAAVLKPSVPGLIVSELIPWLGSGRGWAVGAHAVSFMGGLLPPSRESHLITACWLELLRWAGGKYSRLLKKELQVLLPAHLGIGKNQSQPRTGSFAKPSWKKEDTVRRKGVGGRAGLGGRASLRAPAGHSPHLGGRLAPTAGMLQGHLSSFQLSAAQGGQGVPQVFQQLADQGLERSPRC